MDVSTSGPYLHQPEVVAAVDEDTVRDSVKEWQAAKKSKPYFPSSGGVRE